MKLVDLKLSRFIPGPPDEVFDVWFDPESPGGPWHGAKKALMRSSSTPGGSSPLSSCTTAARSGRPSSSA